VRIIEEGRPIDFILCGLGAGLAVGSNLAVGFVLGLPLLARILREEGSWLYGVVGMMSGLVMVIATNPYLAFSPRHFAWELTIYSPSHFHLGLASLASFAATAVPEGLGVALGSIGALALARGIIVDKSRRLLALLVIGGSLLILGRFPEFAASTSSLRLHYANAAIIVVLAADLLSLFPRPTFLVLCVAVLADVGWRGLAYMQNIRLESGATSTRTLAADWIDQRIPKDSTVGLLRYPEPAHTPPFSWNNYRLIVFEATKDLIGHPLPEWIVARRGGWDALTDDFRGRYEEISDFPSAHMLGLQPRDDSFFANAGMMILRLKNK
jgi:hypothetical protein